MNVVPNSPVVLRPSVTFPLAEILYSGHVVIHRTSKCFLISAVGGPFTVRIGGALSVLNGSVQISTAKQPPVTLAMGQNSSDFADPKVDVTIATGAEFCQIIVFTEYIPDDGSPLGSRPADPSRPPQSSR